MCTCVCVYTCMYGYKRVCMCAHVCVNAHMCMCKPERFMLAIFLDLHLPVFEISSHWPRSSQIQLSWLALKPQGSPCLCFPSPEIGAGVLSHSLLLECWESTRGFTLERQALQRLSHLPSRSALLEMSHRATKEPELQREATQTTCSAVA